MNLRNVEVFVQVAEHGNFTAAARALALSPSVISRRIHELEQSLGATLFFKSTRKMSLTDAGEAFYKSCTRALADLHDGESLVNNLYGKPSGTLRVSSVWGFAETVIVPLIPKFLTLYPDLRLKFMMTAMPINLIETGTDIVIRNGRVMDESSYEHCDIAPVQHLICASPEFFKKHGTPAEPKDISRFNCITHTLYASKEWWFKGTPKDYCLSVRGSLEINNSEALRVAAVSGLGIARLPIYVAAKDIAAGRLQAIFKEITVSRETMQAFYARSEYVPTKIPAFLDFLKQEIEARKSEFSMAG
ncbi:MAG TPA: LysR substrate-binding domain-containing protein [Alphaproteobacteria bacterium]|jgi:DNA-binding transcriptional LysR family regulator